MQVDGGGEEQTGLWVFGLWFRWDVEGVGCVGCWLFFWRGPFGVICLGVQVQTMVCELANRIV